ncbi:MAG TPA: DCC1-like thiol-disulfide oxidoreductase family protein [Bacteroidota bacterium]|jgi:predicted DCC family thiol-disulfide oxidoreductase YuxK|nr:DCC1-like thiol-disulfide oxidoreductase family protein [Bacteroidota bacterium]
MDGTSIILFDGVCNLCNGFVQFVIVRDPEKFFRFASLQSTAAQELLKKGSMTIPDNLSTVVLLEGESVYTQSDAVLRILKHLKGWKYSYVLAIVPKIWRDIVYAVISRYRYRMFGKNEICMVPTPELRDRFLR